MGPRTFQQNYLCFFGDAEQAVFQRDWLDAAMRRDVGELNLQARFADMGSTYVVGVDLGQQRDYTAIVVVERVRRMGELDRVTYQRAEEISYQVRWVERVPLGTSYAAVVDRIRDVVTAPALATRCQLALDATGLGGPVRDFIRKERLGCKLYPVVITSGAKEKGDGDEWKVPKRDLVQGLQVMFEQGTMRIAAGMGRAAQFGVAYLTAIVTGCPELSLSPIFSTSGCGPEASPVGTTAFTCSRPNTRPGAAPA